MMAKDASAVDVKSEERKVTKKKERNTIPTKLVIRRLPPLLTCDELLKAIDPLPPHDSFRYVSGDKTLAPDNFCRAYINLTSPEDLISFRDRVDGLELTDSKGNSQPCILESAPYQKNPRKVKRKEDSKSGTIEEDADYKAFLESLEAEEEKTVLDLEKYLEELEKRDQKNKCVETPLTAFLKQKKEERKRIRDERRRTEQERRKKRDEERRRRDVERKKKLDAEKARKKKEDDKKFTNKKEDSKKDGVSQKEDGDDSKSDRSETHSKGDGRYSGKNKFESERPKSGQRLSDTKAKESEAVRRGPIGVKPRESHGDQDGRDKDGYNDRPHSGKDNYERGGYAGRGGSRSRGGYRGSRDFPPRKWDRNDDSRNSKGSEDNDVKKLEKPKTKRPDREIYRPGSGRGVSSRPLTSYGGSRSHKYSEQRSGSKHDDDK